MDMGIHSSKSHTCNQYFLSWSNLTFENETVNPQDYPIHMRMKCDWQMLLDNMYIFIILLTVMVIGIIGNITVLIVYAQCYKKNNFRFYVLFLTAVDLMGCCLSVPLQLIYSFKHYTLYQRSVIICKMYDIQYAISLLSISIMIVIGADRLRRTTSPLGRQLTYRQARWICILCCIPPIVQFMPSVFMLTVGTTTDIKLSCSVEPQYIDTYHVILVIIMIVSCITLLVCLLVYTALGIFMLHKVRKYTRRICSYKQKCGSVSNGIEQEPPPSNIDVISRSSYLKGARKTCVFIIVAVVSCLFPLPLMFLAFTLLIECNMIYACNDFTASFVHLMDLFMSLNFNHCINPILFAITDRQFRKKCTLLHTRFRSNSSFDT